MKDPAISTPSDETVIGSEIVEHCPLCGALGNVRYDTLKDRVFSAPGTWSLSECHSPECQLLWLSKRPTISEIHKAYKTYYTHADTKADGQLGGNKSARRAYHLFRSAYLSYGLEYINRRTAFLTPLFKAIAHLHPCGPDSMRLEGMCLKAPDHPARLLEVGCGNGYLLQRMQQLGWDVEGLDFDPECLRQVSAAAIRCRLGDVRDQHYPDETFDALYTGSVIEHVFDPAGFVQECARILKPGGRLVIITPNAGSLGHQLYREDWRGLEPPRHLQIFNLKNLTALCRKNALRVIEGRTISRGAWYILGMSKALRAARLDNKATRQVKLISFVGISRQILGRFWGRLRSNSGEELLVIAIKK